VRVSVPDCIESGWPASNEGKLNSAIRKRQSAISFLRRSRGYAPDPIPLRDEGPEVMGCGADLKNTFTLTKGKFAITSQHIGDMENYETLNFYEESLENLKTVYRANPMAIVHDLHPGYLSTRWAQNYSTLRTPHAALKLYGIQHHYAHIGSVMAEHGITGKVIGVAFDGTGYGTDGNLWGGEFLIADIDGFERGGQFHYVALPGGEAAIKEPWRTAVSYIKSAAGDKSWECFDKIGFTEKYGKDLLEKVMAVARSRELSPLASGAGRLFDAVSALLGLCDKNTFEGEAAMTLESVTCDGIDEEYPVEFMQEKGYTRVNFSGALIAMINDVSQAAGTEIIATKFHNTVCSVVLSMTRSLSRRHKVTKIVLSGGTFQNLYLLNRTVRLLLADGMQVFINRKAPCNDGGISLGQAYLVRERLKRSPECGVRNAEFRE
jgi:hydrogenase maturation protein HypF